jgi:ectoine hydroxylase-related dioxygenase (phytanoyl-CoA dioxygenase family)
MHSLRETIKQTGRSPIFRVSWSENQLDELRTEGAHKLWMAANHRWAQFDLHHSWPKLLDLITDKAILSRYTEVFEEDSFQLIETRIYPKAPQSPAYWHIDISQLECYEPSLLYGNPDVFRSVTTWLALDDVPFEMGALQMLHYKHFDLHKLLRIRRNKGARRYRKKCAAEAEHERNHVETLPMKAGEFCMFDPRNLHTGAANQTNRYRLGLVMRYCASHVKVNPRFSKLGDLRIIPIRNGRLISSAT